MRKQQRRRRARRVRGAENEAKRAPQPGKEAAEKAAATAKEAHDKVRAKADAAGKTLDDLRTKGVANFDTLLAAMEKYFGRTVPWNPGLAALDASFKP